MQKEKSAKYFSRLYAIYYCGIGGTGFLCTVENKDNKNGMIRLRLNPSLIQQFKNINNNTNKKIINTNKEYFTQIYISISFST